MRGRAAAVTGLGIVSPLGVGQAEFRRNLVAGRSAVRVESNGAISLAAARVNEGFDAAHYVQSRALKYVGRASRMLAAAVAMALQDAGISPSEDEVAMVIGTALGNFPQTAGYTRQIMEQCPVRLSPMSGFDAAQNSAVSFTAAVCKIRGCVRTVATGWTSSARALAMAARMVRVGIAEVVVAGGVEQVTPIQVAIYREQGVQLARRLAAPFSRGRCGISLGEGGYVLVIEAARRARGRGARIYGEIASWRSPQASRFGNQRRVLDRVMSRALAEAGLAPREVGAVSAAANGSRGWDRIEGQAIASLFGGRVPVVALKALVGESCGAAAAAQAAQALLAVYHGELPPVAGLDGLDWELAISPVIGKARCGSCPNVLVNSADPTGRFNSFIIRQLSANAGEGEDAVLRESGD